jgi:hypothetical protein
MDDTLSCFVDMTMFRNLVIPVGFGRDAKKNDAAMCCGLETDLLRATCENLSLYARNDPNQWMEGDIQ